MAVEKLLPQSVDSEANTLGSLFIDPEAYNEIGDRLSADDFYRDANRTIYESVVSFAGRGEAFDLEIIADDLQRQGKLADIGGISYLTSLPNRVPSSRNIVQYAQIVARTAMNRRLINAAGQIAGIAYNDPAGDDALEQAEQLIFNISQGQRQDATESVATLTGTLLDVLDTRQREREQGIRLGIPTGLSDLDKQLGGGLRGGRLYILAARPSVGKTSLALSIADASARLYDSHALIFSLEMSREEVVERLLAMRANVDSQHVQHALLTDDEWIEINRGAGELGNVRMRINDTAALTLAQMRSIARRAVARHGIDYIIVDYLQLMQGSGTGSGTGSGGSKRDANRVQEVSEISRGLKLLARELNVPVFALSQLSRAVESRQDKTPQLSDLRDSGTIEQDADVVLFIYRDEVYNPETDRPHIAEIHVAKNRHGPTGQVSLYFQAHITRYRTLARWTTGAQEMTGPASDDVA